MTDFVYGRGYDCTDLAMLKGMTKAYKKYLYKEGYTLQMMLDCWAGKVWLDVHEGDCWTPHENDSYVQICPYDMDYCGNARMWTAKELSEKLKAKCARYKGEN